MEAWEALQGGVRRLGAEMSVRGLFESHLTVADLRRSVRRTELHTCWTMTGWSLPTFALSVDHGLLADDCD